MKSLLITVMLVSINLHANEKGNGGDIEELNEAILQARMMDREALTSKGIDQLASQNGRAVKTITLRPLMEHFLKKDTVVSDNVEDIKRIFKNDEGELLNDIMYAPIRIGNCEDQKEVCTSDKAFSDITLDKNNILNSRFGVSMKEMVALIMHEYTHHYAGQKDHPKYAFTREMIKFLESREYMVKVFSINNKMASDRPVVKVLKDKFLLRNTWAEAKAFCRTKNYRTAKTYNVRRSSLFTDSEISMIGVLRPKFQLGVAEQLLSGYKFKLTKKWDNNANKEFISDITCTNSSLN